MSEDAITPDRVRDWLRVIPDLAALLPDALVTRTASVSTSRPAPGSRPPIRLDILHLLDTRDRTHWETGMQWCDPEHAGVLPYLHGWCCDLESYVYDLWDDELVDQVPAEPTISNCCAWLLQDGLLDWAEETLHAWDEFAQGVRHVHAELRHATADVRDRDVQAVPCWRCGDPLTRIDERALWECNSGHIVNIQPTDLQTAARDTGIPLRTLQDWAKKGRLTRLRESERSSIYDLGDIRRVAAERRLMSG